MSADLAAWATHPVTLILVASVVLAVFTLIEVLLRALAEIGNVRFQGMLEDHRNLFPIAGDRGLHLSRLIDVLRWLQLGSVGLVWLTLSGVAGIGTARGLALSLVVPLVVVVVARLTISGIGEDLVAVLLRIVRPLVVPLVIALVRLLPAYVPPPSAEDEEEEASDREIKAYLEAGQAAGIFESEEGEFVESLVDFFDTVVREVMTPRTDMVAMPDTATFEELLQTFALTHKSRIPVYNETVDRVLGVVHVKDLVTHMIRGVQPPIKELINDCLVVPESKPLGEVLKDFQQAHQQMAIVVDEYGGTSGLVTLEDVLEEIVGDIHDEHDPSRPPEWQEVSPGVYRMQGRAALDVLEELFDIEVQEDDIETVGGLVFARHGTVPEQGTEVKDDVHGLEFTVEEMEERRVVSVVVRRQSKVTESRADAPSS
jgi:CBS domain containing-hemolysin-like protein